MSPMRQALLWIAASLASGMASAQNVYRCGNSYSQTPCADGRPVDVHDPRSAAQKADADVATRRNAKAAELLEKARHRDEAAQRPAQRDTRPTKAVASSPAQPKNKTKKKAPEYFTAAAPKAKPPPPAQTGR